MGTGAWGWECGNGNKGKISWGREHGDDSMGMGAWDESIRTTAWGWELFSVILFSDYFECFLKQMISFITLAWKNGDGKHGDGNYFWYSVFRQL